MRTSLPRATSLLGALLLCWCPSGRGVAAEPSGTPPAQEAPSDTATPDAPPTEVPPEDPTPPDAGPPEDPGAPVPSEPIPDGDAVPDGAEPPSPPVDHTSSTVRGPTRPATIVDGAAPVHPDGRQGERAAWKVLIHLDAAGHLEDVHYPDDMPPRFRDAAQEAIAATTYAPALRDGRPAPTDMILEIVFEPPPELPDDAEVTDTVLVESERDTRPVRSIGDVRILVDDVDAVASSDPAELLELAPGVLITRVGSDVAPPRIFLRGFDARHGQDIAFHLDGLPLNQVGNPHGHGQVDLNAIPAEAVRGLRLQQGPFDPSQGDFAVAGSATFDLGLAEPGLMLRGTYGTWNTGRAVVGWRHRTRPGFFVLGELLTTEGYGDNRGALRGNGMVRLEGGSSELSWHVLGGFYGASWDSAGVVRQADVEAGRIDLYGTQDPAQGGASQQGFVTGGVEGDDGDTTWSVTLSAALRNMAIRNNFTGFLLDDRRPGESPHDQRGDLLEQRYRGWTLATRAKARRTFWGQGAVSGAVEAGLDGRLDDVDGASLRLRDLDSRAYRTDNDYGLLQGHTGLWAGGELVVGRLTARAGGRLDGFFYQLLDRCASKDTWFPGAELDDVNCADEDRYGVVRRDQRRRAQGLAASPRATLAVDLGRGHGLMAGGGRGIRSLEALALSNDEDASFGDLWAGEVGWEHKAAGSSWTAVHRVAAYTTHVRRDLVFDEVEGANVAAGRTARWGGSLESDVHWLGLTARTTLTYTYAVFGDDIPANYSDFNTDRQAGMLVPYIPPVVLRSDVSWRHRVGPVQLAYGAGLTYLSPRPLPQSQRGEHIATLDLSASGRWRGIELGVVATNVTNARYPLAEFNFSSWFPDVSGTAFPTRVPSRQVSPGAPLGVMATLTLWPEAL